MGEREREKNTKHQNHFHYFNNNKKNICNFIDIAQVFNRTNHPNTTENPTKITEG